MNRHLVLTALTSCMLIPSCRVLNQRVDLSWFGDTMAPAQSDSVYVEAGRGLPTTERPAFLGTEKHTDAVAAAPAMPAPPEPIPAGDLPPTEDPLPAPAATATPPAPAVAAAVPATAAPAAPAKPVAGAHAAPRTHTVAKGDTLAAIARRYHSSVPAICSANGITNPNALKLGTVLNIPDTAGHVAAAPPTPQKAQKPQAAKPAATAAATATPKRRFWQFWKKAPAATTQTHSYTVRQGDTLNAIAHRHGVTPAALMRANGMGKDQANRLRIGQNIIIPAPKK